jgi:hypothetical protein
MVSAWAAAGTGAMSCRCAASAPRGIVRSLRIRRIVDASARWPGFSSSPRIFLYPRPVFAQHGAGRDHPVHPQTLGQEPDQGGEDGAVGPVQARPGMGAAQHGDFVPQHEQFRVLGRRRTAGQDQPAAEPDEDQVRQAKGHGRSSCPLAGPGSSLQLRGQAEFSYPRRTCALDRALSLIGRRVAGGVRVN